jgi:hypothetical protein
MTFLNAALLAGMAAFVVPLVIHLLNRSRFQVVPWAAMHLLDFTAPQNTRRWQWQSLLLLLVRCAIPIVLALCMARPVLTWWRGLQGDGDVGIALLIDNSYSMQAPRSANALASSDAAESRTSSALESAAQQAASIVDRGATGSQFALLETADARDQNVAPEDAAKTAHLGREQMRERLSQITYGHEPVDLLQSLQQLLATAEVFRRSSSSVVVLSDFRAVDWESIGDEALAALRKRAEDHALQTSITLLQVDARDVPNRSVHFAADQLTHARVGQPLEVTVTVRNDAHDATGPVPVVAQVDGTDLGTKRVSLPAGAQAQVSFVCRFDQAGFHNFTVRITDDSPVAADNEETLQVAVLPTLKCLIVDDSSPTQLLDRDSGFLQLALGAQPATKDQLAGPFEVTAVRSSQPLEELLPVADIIVLANVARLSDAVSALIGKRVAAGAYLVLFPGESLDRNWYVSAWGPGSEYRLLPSVWGELERLDTGAPSVSIRQQVWEHPALSFFNREGNGQLDRVQIRQYVQLTPHLPAVTPVAQRSTEDVESGTSLPIAWLSTGDPWLVVKPFGRGSVLQCAMACNNSWSNWPMRPSFVPAMQRLLSSPFDSDEEVGPARARESKLERLSESRLSDVATALGATVCTSADEYLASQAQRNRGRELWRPLLWTLVGLLVGELFLQQYLARGPQ